MSVSAIVVTRGDVGLREIMATIPNEWEIVVWDNGLSICWRVAPGHSGRASQSTAKIWPAQDYGPHGRFAAIEYASGELVYCQDDDVLLSEPQAIIAAWQEVSDSQYDFAHPDYKVPAPWSDEHVVCNLPQEFRPHYPDSAMVGFGAAFHRDAPERAFQRFFACHTDMSRDDPLFLRESCRVFTTLTPRVLVDVPKTDLPWASAPNRLWMEPEHVEMRERMLVLAREARDRG